MQKKGEKYRGLDRRRNNKGQPKMILEGSSDEGIIADWMEANLGFRMTTIMVNQHRVEEGRFPVGRNAVMNAFDRMNPILSKIQKRCQGDTNNEA